MTRITVLRHSIAEEEPADNHRERRLSDEGREKARRRRENLGNPVYSAVLSSPLPRARETAAIIGNVDLDKVITVFSLFPGPNDPLTRDLDDLFKELGHAPLRDYLADPHNRGRMVKKIALRGWAEIQDVFHSIRKKRDIEVLENILIVGHGILINALGIELVGQHSLLERRVFAETEGFTTYILMGNHIHRFVLVTD